MRRFSKKIISLIFILCGLLFSSCGSEDLGNALAAPANVWYRTSISYDEPTTLYVYFYYTDNQIKVGKENLIPGLTIIVTGNDGSWTSNDYVLQTFSKDSSKTVGSGSDTYTFTGSHEKWSAIYWSNQDLRQNKNVKPSQIENGNKINENGKFSWKRLLADYLLSTL